MPLTKAQVVTSLSTHDMLSNRRYFDWSEELWLGREIVSVKITLNHSIRKGVYRVPTNEIAKEANSNANLQSSGSGEQV